MNRFEGDGFERGNCLRGRDLFSRFGMIGGCGEFRLRVRGLDIYRLSDWSWSCWFGEFGEIVDGFGVGRSGVFGGVF